jgi:hypothetical protein
VSGGENDNNESVRVTAVERPHPAIRQLARAAISLARLRMARRGRPVSPSDEGTESEAEVPRG